MHVRRATTRYAMYPNFDAVVEVSLKSRLEKYMIDADTGILHLRNTYNFVHVISSWRMKIPNEYFLEHIDIKSAIMYTWMTKLYEAHVVIVVLELANQSVFLRTKTVPGPLTSLRPP